MTGVGAGRTGAEKQTALETWRNSPSDECLRERVKRASESFLAGEPDIRIAFRFGALGRLTPTQKPAARSPDRLIASLRSANSNLVTDYYNSFSLSTTFLIIQTCADVQYNSLCHAAIFAPAHPV